MIPAAFDYHAPATVPEAIALLSRFGDTAKVISGGQSLCSSSAMETPSWETDKTVRPCPHQPFGAKGEGESATVGAPPAIANAVVDAVSHVGVRHVDIPITPEKVWRLLKENGLAE
jgi:carbon-monoxide dehydrogenase large subunit